MHAARIETSLQIPFQQQASLRCTSSADEFSGRMPVGMPPRRDMHECRTAVQRMPKYRLFFTEPVPVCRFQRNSIGRR
jgi:hypothetical protein